VFWLFKKKKNIKIATTYRQPDETKQMPSSETTKLHILNHSARAKQNTLTEAQFTHADT